MKDTTFRVYEAALDALGDIVGRDNEGLSQARAHLLGIGRPEEVTDQALQDFLGKLKRNQEVNRLPADVRLVFDRLNDYPDLQAGIFIKAWHLIAQRAHANAVAKDFWPEGEAKNIAEQIALIHSELSEALEANRHGNPPDPNVPGFGNFEVELADAVIRIMDTTAAYGLPVAEALIGKMRYNASRPAKHGKAY